MLRVKFSHLNIPDRVQEFTGTSITFDRRGYIFIDGKEIGLYYIGFDGQYWRVWDGETFYKIYSDIEINEVTHARVHGTGTENMQRLP